MAAAENVAKVSSHGVTLSADLHARLHQTDHRTLLRFACFVVLYLVSVMLILRLQSSGMSILAASIACIPLYLVAAGSLPNWTRMYAMYTSERTVISLADQV